MGDVDDVDIYVAEPIWRWQQTDQGRWVMEHAHNLTYHTMPSANSFGHNVVIRGEINDPHKITEYYLRWPNQEKY